MAKRKDKDEGNEAPQQGRVLKSISQRKLKQLMAAKRSANNDIHEIGGTLGQQIRDAIENDNLHRKAFGWVCQLDKMEPEKLADALDYFEHYLDISGLRERAATAPRPPVDEAEDDDADQDDGKVHQLHAAE